MEVGCSVWTGAILASICFQGKSIASSLERYANGDRSHDSKAKVWRIETRSCVATHSHGDKPLWSAKWLPKVPTKSEMFALAGGNNSISFYREAAG